MSYYDKDDENDSEPYIESFPDWNPHGKYESYDEYCRDHYGTTGFVDEAGNFYPLGH